MFNFRQVLETLDFAGHTTAYACFGLGMVLLGLLLIAFTLLEFSTITYTPLGHVGKAFLKSTDLSLETAGNGEDSANSQASAEDMKGYEMVPTSTNDNDAERPVPAVGI